MYPCIYKIWTYTIQILHSPHVLYFYNYHQCSIGMHLHQKTNIPCRGIFRDLGTYGKCPPTTPRLPPPLMGTPSSRLPYGTCPYVLIATFNFMKTSWPFMGHSQRCYIIDFALKISIHLYLYISIAPPPPKLLHAIPLPSPNLGPWSLSP